MSQGKHLPSIHVKHHKNTAGVETAILPIPDVVKIDMSQSIGAPCKPLVKKGDAVKVGQKIGDTDAFVSAPVHSSVSGTVKDIIQVTGNMGRPETLIVIETDKKQEVSEEVKPPKADTFEEFIAGVRASGVVGLGGASFPTHIKLNPKNLEECDTLIVNGAECEPFITVDNRIMVEDGQLVADGMRMIMDHLNLKQGFIGIEDNKPDAIENMKRVFEQNGYYDMQVFPLPSSYPKGAERVLVYEITGKTMNAGVLPADLGVILDNVTTVAAISEFFKTGMPLVRRRVTVDGDAVKEPKNVMVPVGTQVTDVATFCGGYRCEPKKIILGGPMMGRAINSDSVPTVKNTGSILMFGNEAAQVKEETQCINCGRCHTACPFGLMPMIFAEAYERREVERLEDFRIMQCMSCGSCSYVCPARRPLSFTNTLAKSFVKGATAK